MGEVMVKALAFEALLKVLDGRLIAGDGATLDRCASFARFLHNVILTSTPANAEPATLQTLTDAAVQSQATAEEEPEPKEGRKNSPEEPRHADD